ncbi:esterase [Candidimonas sp. SYP-B2681]|uniref:esterase n=1 Tax=Candidimonas sp. SYP-B2681 TaxID=2497686 RepID=UPI001F24C70E|nr:esterase [Candidimonas sp. SYP-B2681]
MNPTHPQPFVFVPKHGAPRLLFVLLHGESATPEQLFPLAEAIKHAFPFAVVVLPYGSVSVQSAPSDDKRAASLGYHWVNPEDLASHNYSSRMYEALPDLIGQIQQLQIQYDLSGEQTALAGFSQGASMALEASLAQPDIAGRVLAFSGLYASMPDKAAPASLLHFFHGSADQDVPTGQVEATVVRISELQGDATLDVASAVGHELHRALIKQAIVRLQTCVPLRSWEEAITSLQQIASDKEPLSPPDCNQSANGTAKRTLH